MLFGATNHPREMTLYTACGDNRIDQISYCVHIEKDPLINTAKNTQLEVDKAGHLAKEILTESPIRSLSSFLAVSVFGAKSGLSLNDSLLFSVSSTF